MRYVFIFSALVMLTMSAIAQQNAQVVADVPARYEAAVKNAPFSCEIVSESVQTLFDGNRIVHRSSGKMYRNSDGHVRREMGKGTGGVLSTAYGFGSGVSIMDPMGSRYLLDSYSRTAKQMSVVMPQRIDATALNDEQKRALEKLRTELKINDGTKITDEQRAAIKKLKAELKITAPLIVTKDGFRALDARTPLVSLGSSGGLTGSSSLTVAGIGSGSGTYVYSTSGQSKYESKTEQLGIRNIEGVDAEGTRTTTTIPADAIGNERPIEMIYERWYSKDLGMVIYSKNSDPRFGEQTYRLTNIVRAEPDPSLFSLPSGYKVFSDRDGDGQFKVFTTTRSMDPVKAVSPVPAKTKPNQQ